VLKWAGKGLWNLTKRVGGGSGSLLKNAYGKVRRSEQDEEKVASGEENLSQETASIIDAINVAESALADLAKAEAQVISEGKPEEAKQIQKTIEVIQKTLENMHKQKKEVEEEIASQAKIQNDLKKRTTIYRLGDGFKAIPVIQGHSQDEQLESLETIDENLLHEDKVLRSLQERTEKDAANALDEIRRELHALTLAHEGSSSEVKHLVNSAYSLVEDMKDDQTKIASGNVTPEGAKALINTAKQKGAKVAKLVAQAGATASREGDTTTASQIQAAQDDQAKVAENTADEDTTVKQEENVLDEAA